MGASSPAIAAGTGPATRSPRERLVAWSAWLIAVGFSAAGLWFLYLNRDLVLPDTWGVRGFPVLFAVTFGTVGAFVLARRPGNVVGWLLAVAGMASGVQLFAAEYATYALVAVPGSLPAGVWLAWLTSWIWIWEVITAGPLLFLLFPDGRLVSGPYRPVVWLAIVAGLVASAGFAFAPGPLNSFPVASNPLGAPGLEFLRFAILGVVLSLILGAASLVVRYRRATGEERQQLKWVAFAAAIVGLVGPLGFLPAKPGQVAFIVAIAGIPIAAGVAVLRYGLYEIDTIINRALVYGLLTAILAGISAASIGLMERLFQGATGQGSDVAIVLSTLVVVSGFTPVKERLQRLVDRRFKDARDPSSALAAFTAAITNGVWWIDPDRVMARLLELAAEASGAAGGAIQSQVGQADRRLATVGQWRGNGALEVSALVGEVSATLSLASRRQGQPYTARNRDAIQAALTAMVAQIDSQRQTPLSAIPSEGDKAVAARSG